MPALLKCRTVCQNSAISPERGGEGKKKGKKKKRGEGGGGGG